MLISSLSSVPGLDIALGVLIGVVAIGFLIVQTHRAGLPDSLWAAFGLTAAGSLLFVPLAPVANRDSPDGGYSFDVTFAAGQILYLLNLILAVGAVALLRRVGSSGRRLRRERVRPGGIALRVPEIWTAGLVLLACAAMQVLSTNWFNVLSLAALILTWYLLAPPKGRLSAARRANVSKASHQELLSAETRRRLAQLGAHDLYRKSRGRLGADETSWPEYDRRQRQLDEAASSTGQLVAGIPVVDALSTGGGSTPWQNATRAVWFATPVALLIIGYEIFAFARSNDSLSGLELASTLILALHWARWFVYALIFGYFYPLLRGRSPVVKALALAAALLATEVLPILGAATGTTADSSIWAPASPHDLALATAIRVGQIIVFFATLGLLWERWLANAADYRWDRIRNIHSLRALATPAGTVIIAAATAAATALASASVAALLASGTHERTPPTQPSSVARPR
jgi:hypothetical protein